MKESFRKTHEYITNNWQNAVVDATDKNYEWNLPFLAGERAMKDGEEKKLGYLETRNLKVEYIKEAVKHKMALFGSVNKA